MIDGSVNLTYGQLTTQFLNWIKNNCSNINSISESVPEEYKDGYTVNLANATYSISMQAFYNVVSSDTVDSQFNDFMSSRGIIAKSSVKVSTKGIINFWNNVAAFCSVRIVMITGVFSNGGVVRMYNPNGVTYPEVSGYSGTELIAAADINSALGGLEGILNNVSKALKVNYSQTKIWCSCSSSSSSSSSSSCSSSSSAFIGYMKI